MFLNFADLNPCYGYVSCTNLFTLLVLRFIRVFSAVSASITLSSLGKWNILVLQRKTVLYSVATLCKYSSADNLMNFSVGP